MTKYPQAFIFRCVCWFLCVVCSLFLFCAIKPNILWNMDVHHAVTIFMKSKLCFCSICTQDFWWMILDISRIAFIKNSIFLLLFCIFFYLNYLFVLLTAFNSVLFISSKCKGQCYKCNNLYVLSICWIWLFILFFAHF